MKKIIKALEEQVEDLQKEINKRNKTISLSSQRFSKEAEIYIDMTYIIKQAMEKLEISIILLQDTL